MIFVTRIKPKTKTTYFVGINKNIKLHLCHEIRLSYFLFHFRLGETYENSINIKVFVFFIMFKL